MIVVIGKTAEPIRRYLEGNGFYAVVHSPDEVPSLTAFLLQRPEITNIVLLEGEEHSWSMGHILAAAKQLQSKGRIIFMGQHGHQPALISVAPDSQALLQLLRRPVTSAGSSSGSNGGRVDQQAPVIQQRRVTTQVRPLPVPPDKILMLGVIGSQHRIGCTTQAVGLWHYCKALGFDPAIVSSPEQTAQLAGPMHSQQIPGGYQIEGIPFITDTAQAYDCYILDIGPGDPREALRVTDHLILVAGSKPWELRYTAEALRAARGEELLIFLSFSTSDAAKTLQPLFGRQTAAVLPWMPELWQPSAEALEIYDSVLRPILEQILSRGEELPEPEPLPAKDLN